MIYVVQNSGISCIILTSNLPTVILVEILECCVKVLFSIQFVHVHCCGDKLVIVN
jgi:hypothetical protein